MFTISQRKQVTQACDICARDYDVWVEVRKEGQSVCSSSAGRKKVFHDVNRFVQRVEEIVQIGGDEAALLSTGLVRGDANRCLASGVPPQAPARHISNKWKGVKGMQSASSRIRERDLLRDHFALRMRYLASLISLLGFFSQIGHSHRPRGSLCKPTHSQ